MLAGLLVFQQKKSYMWPLDDKYQKDYYRHFCSLFVSKLLYLRGFLSGSVK